MKSAAFAPHIECWNTPNPIELRSASSNRPWMKMKISARESNRESANPHL